MTKLATLLSLIVLFVTGGYSLILTDPCPLPVTYSIGSIDGRFNYSAEKLAIAINKAERVWEEELGRELFVHDPDSQFTVNLVYDERQKEARTEEEWRLRLNDTEEKTKDLEADLDRANQDYGQSEGEYLDERAAYEVRLNAYNERVDQYNESGGAPQDVFTELENERRAINQLLKKIQQKEQDLQVQVKKLNQLADELNQLVDSYNEEVNRYNAIYGSREAYTQGDFDYERINIYKFSNDEELVKVLAHEFGHALGIDHVDDEKAIMFHLMDDERSEVPPTVADLEAFTLVCSGENDPWYGLRQVVKKVLSY